jgi:hypothetical protein
MAHLVAAGLLGTGVSGHVIQTVWKQNEAQSHNSVGDGNTYTSTEIVDTITTREANSKILLHSCSMGTHCQQGTFGRVWWQRNVHGGSVSQLEESKLVDNFYNRGASTTNTYMPLILNYMDAPGVAAGTTITYATRYERQTGTNSFYYVHNGFGVLVVLQEISA